MEEPQEITKTGEIGRFHLDSLESAWLYLHSGAEVTAFSKVRGAFEFTRNYYDSSPALWGISAQVTMNRAGKSLALALSVVLLAVLTGCGGGGPTGVMITSPSTQSIDAGQTVNVTATVTHDSGNAGVSWGVTGGGALSNSTSSSVTYTAPASVTTATTVTVTATSVKDGGKTATVTITVNPAPAITISTLSSGTVGTAYSATLTASGGVSPLTWSVSSGSLPTGLTMSGTGVITGTPTAPGSSTFTVKVTDSAGTPISATQQLSISIVPVPLAITTTTATLTNGVAGSAYSATVTATGGTGTITWSATGLPAGLTISSSGAITGTPTGSGVFPVVFTATDSGAGAYQQTKSTTLNLTIIPTLSVTTPAAQNAITGTAFSLQMQASGGVPSYTWSATGLPAGLSIAATTGVISGTPSAAGTSSATVTVSDAGTPKQTKSATVSFTVIPKLVISTTSLANAVAGTAYSAALASTGGTGSVTWSVTGGSLPAGLSLSSSGAITGTTTAAGTVNITVSAVDSGTGAQQQTATQALSLTVIPQLAITTSSLPNGTANTPYSQTVQATGGVTGYTWSASGLPAGLSIASGTGVISGSTGLVGTFSVAVTVKDSGVPQQTATANLSLTTVPAPLAITTNSLPGGEVSLQYSAVLTSSGGTGGITWTTTGGALPAGLSLNASTGAITGTPTTAGTSNVTVMAADSGSPQQTQSASLSIQIYPQLTITTTSLPAGTVGTAYSVALQSTGGSNTITWSLAGGTLPAGLTLGSNGAISGTPTASGNYSLTVQANDSFGAVTKVLTLAVSGGPLGITTASLAGGTVNIPYNATLQASGGTQPYTWSLTSGTLPAGLSLNASTGAISGTPTAAANSVSLTFKVTDSSGTPLTASQNYTLTIVAAGVNNSELKGSYVFLFNGFNNGNAAGKVYGQAVIGVLTADGNGSITSGVLDQNSATGAATQVSATGVYSIGADNRGTLVVTTGSSSTTLAVALGGISGGIASEMEFIEFDDTSSTNGTVGSGFAKLQAASVATALSGSYVFGLQGESPCNTCASPATPYGPVTAVGVFSVASGTVSAGQEDGGAFGTMYSGITLSGSAAVSSGTAGRGTLTLTPTGTLYPAAPTHFVYYVVSSNEALMMSTDDHGSATLLSGDLELQQQSSFNNNSLTGTMIGSQFLATDNGDGLSIYPTGSDAELLMISVPTSGTLNVSHDQNNNGTIKSGTLGSFSYTVASNGRVSLGSGAPVFYLYNTGAAFGVSNPGSSENAGLITFEPQAAIVFNSSTLNGSFIIGTNAPPVSEGVTSGVLSISSGSGNITTDHSDPSGTLTSGQSNSFTMTVDSTGRVVIGSSGQSTTVLYIISAQKALAVDVKSGNTHPTINVVSHQ